MIRLQYIKIEALNSEIEMVNHKIKLKNNLLDTF